jgi:CelD/BcsL family acetyltransferase involved in cellulose biosynthesis
MKNVCIKYWKSEQEVFDHKEVWEDLYKKSDSSPYLSHDWITTALKYFRGNNILRFGYVTINGKSVAIVPLEIVKEKIKLFRIHVLRFVMEGWSLQNGAIIADNVPAFSVIYTVIHDLIHSNPNWKYCCLSRFPADVYAKSPNFQEDGMGLRVVVARMGRTVVIEIPKTWDGYKKTLSNAHRKNLARRMNAIERAGIVRFVRLGLEENSDLDKLSDLINDALIVSRNSWQHQTSEGWAISDAKTGSFFAEVSKKLSVKGMLDLSVLYLNDKPISFIWGGARLPHSTINKLGFDQAYSELSPGFVHLAMHIQDSIEKDISEIDFGHEYFDYKAAWGKRYDDLLDVFLYPQGMFPSTIRWLRSKKHQLNGDKK